MSFVELPMVRRQTPALTNQHGNHDDVRPTRDDDIPKVRLNRVEIKLNFSLIPK